MFQGCCIWRHTPKTSSVWPRMKISLKGCIPRIRARGGGVDLRPPPVQTRGSSQVVRRGGGGGVVPGGVSPRAFPQVRRCFPNERLCSSVYLSTRDRTSLLLEESSQSLGSSIPLPHIANTGAHTLLRAYMYCRPMPRSLERS